MTDLPSNIHLIATTLESIFTLMQVGIVLGMIALVRSMLAEK